jgi:hypothetical protein
MQYIMYLKKSVLPYSLIRNLFQLRRHKLPEHVVLILTRPIAPRKRLPRVLVLSELLRRRGIPFLFHHNPRRRLQRILLGPVLPQIVHFRDHLGLEILLIIRVDFYFHVRQSRLFQKVHFFEVPQVGLLQRQKCKAGCDRIFSLTSVPGGPWSWSRAACKYLMMRLFHWESTSTAVTPGRADCKACTIWLRYWFFKSTLSRSW